MFSGFRSVNDTNQFGTGSTKEAPLGTRAVDADGRVFRYVLAGATALDRGKLMVAATQAANHENLAVVDAVAVGGDEVNVTLGATAVTANQYLDGYLIINDVDGEGHTYRIVGHAAANASANVTIKIEKPGVQVALTTSSQASLVLNPWASIVVSATDQADLPVGVAAMDIAAAEYGWVQTGGVAGVLADEAITAGQAVTIGTGVAGAVEAADLIGEPIVGTALQAGVDTEYRAVYLTLDC